MQKRSNSEIHSLSSCTIRGLFYFVFFFLSLGKFLAIRENKFKSRQKNEKEKRTFLLTNLIFVFGAYSLCVAAFSGFFTVASALWLCVTNVLLRLLAAPWNAGGKTRKTTIHLYFRLQFRMAPVADLRKIWGARVDSKYKILAWGIHLYNV